MPPEMAMGSASTIQILNILLPTILPTSKSDSPFLAAVIVVTSSGKEVPRAIMDSEIILSEMPIVVAMIEAELTTSSLPPTIPARPIIVRRKDLLSLYLGFSVCLVSLRFFLASVMR